MDLNLTLRMKADGSGFVGTVKASKDEVEKFAQGLNQAGSATDGLSNKADNSASVLARMRHQVKSVFDELFSLKGLLASLGLTYTAKQFLDASTTSENFAVRLKILLGSTEQGALLFQKMADYAGRVPFEFEAIMASATQLAGIMKGGVAEITEWMPLIGDLSAAAGLSIEETTGQVVRMLSAGAASADLLRERGILAMLGFQAGVTYSAEQTRAQLQQEWLKADSQFRGATNLMASTWTGILSMMSDKWFSFRNLVMNSAPFEYLKVSLSLINIEYERNGDGVKSFAEAIGKGIVDFVKKAALGVATLIDATRAPLNAIKGVFNGFIETWNSLPTWAQEFGILGAILGGKKFILGLAAILGISKELGDWLNKHVADLGTVELPGGEKSILNLITGDAGDSKTSAVSTVTNIIAKLDEKVAELAATSKTTETEVNNLTTSTEGLSAAQQDLLSKLLPSYAALKEYNAALAEIDNIKDPDLYFAARFALEEKLEASLTKTGELKKETISLGEIYKNLAQGLQQTFAQTFNDIWQNGIESFEDFGKRLYVMFGGILSQMAAASLTAQLFPTAMAGVATINPLAAAGIIGGGAILGTLFGSNSRAAERDRRNREARDLVSELEQDLTSSLRTLRGESSEAAEELRKLSAEVSNAYRNPGRGDALDRAKAERELYDLTVKRHEKEKEYLNDMLGAVQSLAEKVKGLKAQIGEDLKQLSGDPGFRSPEDIRAAAERAGGPLGYKIDTSVDRYLGARSDENYYNESSRLFSELDRAQKYAHSQRPSPDGDYVSPNYLRYQAEVDRLRGELDGSGWRGVGVEQGIKASAEGAAAAIATAASNMSMIELNTQAFVDVAGPAIDQLVSLREETWRWYDAQVEILNALRSASAVISTTLTDLRRSQLTPVARVEDMLTEFNSVFASARGASGLELASYANQLNSLANPLVTEAYSTYGSTGGYQSILNTVVSSLEEIRGKTDGEITDIDTIQAETLAAIEEALGGIGGQIAEIVKALQKGQVALDSATIDSLRGMIEQISVEAPDVSIKVVTPDGKEIIDTVLDELDARSSSGEQVVDLTPIWSNTSGASPGGGGGFGGSTAGGF